MKTLLFVLSGFIGITSILSGLLMITYPDGSPMNLSLTLLEGTPFKDFQIPGLILTAVVGGINLAAVLYNIQQHKNRYNWGIAGGVVICGWIIVQMILIHSVHWLHFVYLGAGVLAILACLQLKGKELI